MKNLFSCFHLNPKTGILLFKNHPFSNPKNNHLIYNIFMKQELEFQRILKTKIENLLKVIGCVVIEGPKQSGKTFLGEKLSQSIFYVQEKGLANEIILDVPYAENPIFNGPKPKLIDEW